MDYSTNDLKFKMISLCGLSEADQLKITTFLRQKLQLNNTKISEILRISDVELGRGIKLKEEDPSELLSDTEADIIEEGISTELLDNLRFLKFYGKVINNSKETLEILMLPNIIRNLEIEDDIEYETKIALEKCICRVFTLQITKTRRNWVTPDLLSGVLCNRVTSLVMLFLQNYLTDGGKLDSKELIMSQAEIITNLINSINKLKTVYFIGKVDCLIWSSLSMVYKNMHLLQAFSKQTYYNGLEDIDCVLRITKQNLLIDDSIKILEIVGADSIEIGFKGDSKFLNKSIKVFDHRTNDESDEASNSTHDYWIYITDYDSISVKGDFRVAESRSDSFFNCPDSIPEKYLKIKLNSCDYFHYTNEELNLNQIMIINELFKDKCFYDIYINSTESQEFFEANIHKIQVGTLNWNFCTNFMTHERREQWAYALAKQKYIFQINHQECCSVDLEIVKSLAKEINSSMSDSFQPCCIIKNCKESADSFEPFKVVVLSKSKSSDKESLTSEEQRIKLTNS